MHRKTWGLRLWRVARAGVLLGSLAVIALLPAARATFPAVNGPIAFWVGPPGSIYLINPDGSGLTEIGAQFPLRDPRISPEGARIVVDDIEGGIYLMPIDGSKLKRISGIDGIEATWTPDGVGIVYTCDASYNQGLCLYDLVSGTGQHISGTLPGDQEPEVSPDGAEVVFTRFDGVAFNIHSIPLAGGVATRRTACSVLCNRATWDPSGSTLAFYALDCGTGGTEPRIALIAADDIDASPGCLANSLDGDHSPSWSPDGFEIVAAEGTVGGDFAGTGLVRLDPFGETRSTIPNTGLSPAQPRWGTTAASAEKKAPEALCGSIFFDAQQKAEGPKSKAAAKFIKGGCGGEDADAATLGAELNIVLDKIAAKAQAAIVKLGGNDVCDPNLQGLLPVDRSDFLDGLASGEDYLSNKVSTTCDAEVTFPPEL